MIGQIIKIHSDFYYVKVNENLIECKVREILKKENIEVYVGDKVKLDEYNSMSNQAAIIETVERTNQIKRPAVANVDQIIIVTTLKKPHVDFLQLDRYLLQSELSGIPVVICVNKSDLIKNEAEKEKLLSTYKPAGYEIIFTSALCGTGIDDLKEVLKTKTSVFCGASGVGKSSLLNAIKPGLQLRTSKTSSKTGRGIHTTRHTELIEVELDDKIAVIADTPGFTYLKFDNVLPEEIGKYFQEINKYASECYFNNCLHLEEVGCNIINNLKDIAPTRYESYKTFIKESMEYKEQLIYSGNKTEETSKNIDSGENNQLKIVKFGIKAREKSRKNKKQKLNAISTLNDAYYNGEDIEDIEY